jgi:predicted double-glycine peptidase
MRRSVAAVLAGSVLAALPAVWAPARAGEVRVTADQAGATATIAVHSWREIPFRSVVRQQYDFSCGSAALATLLHFHYGVKVDEPAVFQGMWKVGDQAKIRKVGFSLLDMKRVLKAHNMTADGFRLNLDQVEAANVPGIVLITVGRYRHFVVIKGVRDGKVLVGDPALGLKIYPRGEFEKIWSGVVFLIHDTPSAPKPAFNRASEWRPWAYAPLDEGIDRTSLDSYANGLPPVYQIRPQVTLPTF